MNSTSSNGRLVDIAWSVAGVLLLLVCGPGLMFVSAAYVEPVVLGIANCVPHSKTQQAVEFALLFGGLGIGFAVALGILSAISRNFISLQTHQRWVAQFHQGAAKMPYPFGLFSSGKFPIWATGFVAQEVGLVTAEKPTFLIDCRTRQGQSGAAVVAYRPSGYRTIKNGRFQSVVSGNPAAKFLGLYSGRVNKDSDLGYVWHSNLIAEVAAEAISVKRAAEKRAGDSAPLQNDEKDKFTS